jgi:signal transduction histidine kinase
MVILNTKQRAQQHLHAVAVIWLVTCGLLIATWVHVQSLTQESKAQQLIVAERDLSNLTRLSQEHVNRTLRSADQVIRFVQSHYLEVGDKLDLAKMTSSGIIDAEIFNQVGVIDSKGIYILANLPIKTKLDLSDREHFKVHVASDNVGLFVSKPVLGRASGKWSIQLTRRINRANGDFAGVVVVSIDPGYFTRFYNELNLGSQGLSALYGLDGIARARKVGAKEEFGTNGSAAQMFARMAQGEQVGTYIQRSVVDGVERIIYFRKVPQYQLAVSTGLDMKDLLAPHRRASNALALQAAIVSLLLLALAVALTRHLRGIEKDTTARNRAEMEIQDRNEQLNTIFALSPDGFVSFDRERRVKYVNPSFVHMTSAGPVQLHGLDDKDFTAWLTQRCEPGTTGLDLTALREKVLSGKPDASVLVEVNGNGKRVLKVSLRSSESSSVSQILYFRDVTHETEVDHMKSEFLSTAAHELRTPMASIFGFSEVLLTQEVDTTTQRELLGIVHKQSALMAKILDELLDLARIESRRGKDFRYTRVSLQDLAGDLSKSFIPPEGRDAPTLVLPESASYVMADSGKLRQALLNVLSNAYKYSPRGGPIVLQVDAKDSGAVGSRVWIHITDQGIGMTPDQRDRVCERFYRADASGKTLGTGLGMSIVKEIVELHGGELLISSEPGIGTRVSIGLPD